MSRKNKFVSYLTLAITLSTLYSLLSTSYAEEPKIKEPIVVNGDTVEYFPDKKQVSGSGNVSITYKDVVLTCDRITVYLDTKEAIAEGDVKITQKNAYFTGEKINYNFETKTGRILNGYINSKPFYGRSEEISKVSDNQVNLKRGYVTTCDLEEPHYRIQARQVRIYLEDRVVAKHILFFIGKVPVLYIPYYVQPLKERSAHATLQVGRDKDWGYYGLSSYRYYFSEIAKGRFLLDYRTKKGVAGGVENGYSFKELGYGNARFYITKENGFGVYEKSGEEMTKYGIQVRHKWDMGYDTIGMLEFNKQRDQNFIKDYFYKQFEEEGDPDNYVSFITTKMDYTTTLLIRKRMDKYFDVVERLPEYSINIPNYRLFRKLPLYLKSETSGVCLNHVFPAAVPENKDLSTIRFDTFYQLSYATKVLGSLSMTPYAGVRQTYYSRNKWGDTNLVRGILTAGVDASIKFYKIYDLETSAWGLDIHKLRHIITPTANYYFTGPPTISSENLNQFDAIDSMGSNNGVKLAIENKLQTKRPQGEDGALKSVDLATLIISTDYAFKFKKNNGSLKYSKFQGIDFQLELEPYSWLYSLIRMNVDTKRCAVQSESIDLVGYGGDNWSLGLGHRYESVETGTSNLITLDATYKINDKWKIRAYERFDALKGTFQEQEYTVYRDLHCWLAEFTYDINSETNEYGFWVVFKLKAFPDYPIGLRRTYYRPQFGSTGAAGPSN